MVIPLEVLLLCRIVFFLYPGTFVVVVVVAVVVVVIPNEFENCSF
jgi:MFS superfamily sulfate permease-like transporter